jgi:hypothetical protein
MLKTGKCWGKIIDKLRNTGKLPVFIELKKPMEIIGNI